MTPIGMESSNGFKGHCLPHLSVWWIMRRRIDAVNRVQIWNSRRNIFEMASVVWLLAATCACLFVGAADSQCTGALDTPPDMSGITPSRKVNALKKFVISKEREERWRWNKEKGSETEEGLSGDYSNDRIVWLPQDESTLSDSPIQQACKNRIPFGIGLAKQSKYPTIFTYLCWEPLLLSKVWNVKSKWINHNFNHINIFLDPRKYISM